MIDAKLLENDSLFISLCRIGEKLKTPFMISEPNRLDRPILFVNEPFTSLTGYTSNEVVGKNYNLTIEQHTKSLEQMMDLLDDFGYAYDQVILNKKDGNTILLGISYYTIFNDDQQQIFHLMFLNDQSKEVQNELVEKSAKQLAFIDPFSGLTNYYYFINQFQVDFNTKTNGFLLLIQPTESMNIVDTFGKKQLSIIQKEMGKRIREVLSEIELLVSRASETSLIVAGKCEDKDISYYVSLLLETVKEPIVLEQIELYISLNIGVVSLDYYQGNVEELVRFSDIALNYSKYHAGNSIVYYQEHFSRELKQKIKIQNELVQAIRNKKIYVKLQPKVDIYSREVVSFEALARWDSDNLGPISPEVFIDLAESMGKINEIDLMIIRQVLEWLKDRKMKNLQLYQVAVNISPTHFYSQNFVDELRKLVKEFDVEPMYLKIELTENVGLVDMNKAKMTLNELKLFGFESSVDDFGIGFSSLSYLHQLPISELKIDRSFINTIHESSGQTIVQTIIQLAERMGLTAVAEGIETEEQLKMIQEMNCPMAQGYYFYKPMLIEQVNEKFN